MNDLRSKLLGIRQYQASKQRAPHKPLLILLALEKFRRTGSSELSWPDVDERLGALLRDFGVPSKPVRPEYPFTHLRSDLFWTLSEDVPMARRSPLSRLGVRGRFTPDIEAALRRNPNQVLTLARAIVENQFTSSIADDVLSAIGFDPDECREGATLTDASARRRSSSWPKQILEAWGGECAFCGFDGRLGGKAVGIEAAHVRWFNFEGPDEPDNGLALCSLHHKLFDRGALGLVERKIVVAQTFSATSSVGMLVHALHGVELQPRPGTSLPKKSHIEWHTSQVFKGMALGS